LIERFSNKAEKYRTLDTEICRRYVSINMHFDELASRKVERALILQILDNEVSCSSEQR
jgi:hypothetical protein